MPAAAKVAVSIPANLLRAVEQTRKRTRQSRSAVVQEALRQWLRLRAQADLIRDYEQGYRQHPESAGETEQALALAVGLLRDEEPW